MNILCICCDDDIICNVYRKTDVKKNYLKVFFIKEDTKLILRDSESESKSYCTFPCC